MLAWNGGNLGEDRHLGGGAAAMLAPGGTGSRILVITTAQGIGGTLAADLASTSASVVTVGDAPMKSVVPHVDSDFSSRDEADRAVGAGAALLGGGFDALVHAASLPDDLLIARTDAMTETAWIDASERPVQRAMFVLQAAHPLLSASQGRIVLVQPTIGISGMPTATAIATAVEGQRILGKVAARQWGAAGISVNFLLVSPELTMSNLEDPPLFTKMAAVGTGYAPPAQRPFGGSDLTRDVFPLLAFLTSAQAGRMTGQTLIADGGAWMLP
jgi:NAD(P)-dependent dehydrogenase (short-subunit alcohol dehydrogenase family)